MTWPEAVVEVVRMVIQVFKDMGDVVLLLMLFVLIVWLLDLKGEK